MANMGRVSLLSLVSLLFWMAVSLAQDPSVVLPQGEIRGVSFIFYYFNVYFFILMEKCFFLFYLQSVFPFFSFHVWKPRQGDMSGVSSRLFYLLFEIVGFYIFFLLFLLVVVVVVCTDIQLLVGGYNTLPGGLKTFRSSEGVCWNRRAASAGACSSRRSPE